MSVSKMTRPVRSDRFENTWAALGALAFVWTAFLSWMIWITFSEPGHCGFRAPCTVDVIFERASPSWSVAWAGWFLAGCISWVLGAEGGSRWRGPAVALVVGALVFGAGMVVTGNMLVSAINATHGP
ncbi:hypothetical protein ACFVVM_27235 [Nocardia sp. NPDC058176]|uniref:hypothetical protein n=1 Tax=Nocardia sp. NPDC058176 TaxID=3346368 RepID=UPI0036DD67B8